jgi:hypothetical protein
MCNKLNLGTLAWKQSSTGHASPTALLYNNLLVTSRVSIWVQINLDSQVA